MSTFAENEQVYNDLSASKNNEMDEQELFPIEAINSGR